MKTQLTTEDLRAIKEIKKAYGSELNILTEDYRESNAKIKPSPKQTDEDIIIDMFMEGSCPDTISGSMKISYSEVEQVLIKYGAL